MTSSDHDHDITAMTDIAAMSALTLPPAEAEVAMAALRVRLTDRADEAGLLDVAYRTLDSPLGPLIVAATPAGLVRLAYAAEGLERVLDRLAEKISPRILAAPRRLDPVARQIDEYFGRRRRCFDLPLDLSLAVDFRRHVLTHLRSIPYGHTASYASVAAAVDNPKAVRAVGSACATNPIPLIIPCHRVVRSDGRIGDYVGGPDKKRQLLELEAGG